MILGFSISMVVQGADTRPARYRIRIFGTRIQQRVCRVVARVGLFPCACSQVAQPSCNSTEAALANPALAPAAMADAGRQLAHVNAEVAMLEERWLELQQQLETMATAAR